MTPSPLSAETSAETDQGRPLSRLSLILISLCSLTVVTIAHYSTNIEAEALHHTYRRLYYIPVVLGAFAYGLRGGIAISILASLAYIPHAFFMHHHQDPAPMSDKVFEMILYILVGALTGWLVDREQSTQRALQRALDERTEMESALIRAGKLSALGQLLSGVAHELRNPLASIIGAAEGLERALLSDPPPIERAQRLLELQQRELQRLDRSIAHFLAFSKMRAPSCVELEVSEVIQRVITLAQHQDAEGTFELSPELEAVVVWADRDHLTQMLLNLTLNAMQARRGQEPFQIEYLYRVQESLTERYHCIGVLDHGIGISAERREEIFEPFYSTRHAGTGLGLSVTSRLIEAHDGHIELDERSDLSCFWLSFPQSRKHLQEHDL